jgi:hypothetical protein
MTIIKEHNKLTFNIHRKPTITDSIIHNELCHPNEHKRSAINYLVNSVNTYPLTQENKDQELTIINEILKNNGYQQLPTNLQHKNKAPQNPTQTVSNTQKDKTKWATFTYFGPETRTITNLFRNTNLTRSRDSSVGIATGYGLDKQVGGSSSPGRVNNFHFSISSRPAGVSS